MKKYLVLALAFFVFLFLTQNFVLTHETASEKLKKIQKEIDKKSRDLKDEEEFKKFVNDKITEIEKLIPQLEGNDLKSAYSFLYRISTHLKKYEEGLKICDKLLTLELNKNEKANVHIMKIGCLIELEKYDEALELADKSIEEFKDVENVVSNLKIYKANTLIAMDRIDEAKKILSEVVEDSENEKFALYVERILKEVELIGTEPKDFEEKSLDGAEFSLKKYKGKWILLDFWATWCGPCLREMPNIIEIYKKYKDRNFVILGISLDNSEDKLKDYINKNKIEWPQYFDGKGWQNKLAQLYNVSGIPYTILINPEGKIYRVNLRGESLKSTLKKKIETDGKRK